MSSIVIVDSHNLCREALCDYIRHADRSLSVEGCSDLSGLRHFMAGKDPDLVLVGREFDGQAGGMTGGIKRGIIVAATDEYLMMDPSLHGVFPRNLSCKAFLGGIYEILAGGTFFPSQQEDALSADFLPSIKYSPQSFHLTVREKEALSYLVKGQSNKDIARALDLQVVTVKLHVRGICRKMKVSNRTQAALMAKEMGWG